MWYGGEILLDSKQQCNLTTVNVKAFVDSETGEMFMPGLIKAQKLSARAGLRMALVELELPEWNRIHERDRLIGCSLTGTQDALSGWPVEKQNELLELLRDTAQNEAETYAGWLRIARPLLVTACKPEGCSTVESLRVTDDGILLINEIEPEFDKNDGFCEVKTPITIDGNRVPRVYKNDIKDILRIRLKNGRIIRVSPAHKLSVGGDWVAARSLKIGDQLDYQLGQYNKTTNVPLIGLTDEEQNTYTKHAQNHPTPTEMSPDLAYLIGAYYANGSFTTGNRIKYNCGYHECHLKVQKLWKQLFDVDTIIHRSNDRDAYTQDFASIKLRIWFDKNNIVKYEPNGDIVIPQAVRSSSVDSILSFIAGYADNDGCFANKTFSIDTSKEQFARHLQEVAEAVGLSFGLSINTARSNTFSKKPMYKLPLSRSFSNVDAIDAINDKSVKAALKGKIQSGTIRSANPYGIVAIEMEESQQTYDIEVEKEHWYYQGALKSHNTLSLVAGGVSPGLHDAHSPYFIRRVRISPYDALAKAVVAHGWSVHAEVGTPDDDITKARTLVVDFPVASGATVTKDDVGAMQQLDRYFRFQKYYTQHNSSNTITVRPEEWADVENEISSRWDDFVGVSFLALDGGTYKLAPYEAITKEEYEEMISTYMPFDPSILKLYESSGMSDLDDNDPDCATGGCPTR